jgi:hypothetical protein
MNPHEKPSERVKVSLTLETVHQDGRAFAIRIKL